MAKMKELRAQLAADLAGLGVPVIDDWIIRAEPPCILLAPPIAGSYVTGSKQFATWTLNLDVIVLVQAQPYDASRAQLEDLIEDVLRNTVDWSLTGVDPPATATAPESTIEFLGTVIHLGKSLNL